MSYLGDFVEDSVVEIFFTTHDGDGGAVAPSTPFEAADVRIYKGHSVEEKTTANGITMTSPFNSITGLHQLSIDTSVDTGDEGFWAAASDYTIVLSPDDETVDGQTVVRVIGQFSIQNRYMRGTNSAALASVWTPTIAGRIDATVSSRGTSTLDAAGVRTAVGLASANLDTQLLALSTYVDCLPASWVTVPTANAVADAVLKRDVDQVEATAPEHSLCTVILAALESSVSGITWTIKRTDGSTTHVTKTLTVDADAAPITGVS